MSDYKKWTNEIGLTDNEIKLLTNIDNVLEISHPNYHKGKSKIHGIGIFASRDIKKGEIIGDVSVHNKYRTPLGRWVNHSKTKNAKFYTKKDLNGVAIAEKNIKKNEEILVNYRDHFKNFDYKKILQELKKRGN